MTTRSAPFFLCSNVVANSRTTYSPSGAPGSSVAYCMDRTLLATGRPIGRCAASSDSFQRASSTAAWKSRAVSAQLAAASPRSIRASQRSAAANASVSAFPSGIGPSSRLARREPALPARVVRSNRTRDRTLRHDHPPGQPPRQRAVVHHELAADEDVFDPVRVLVRLGESRTVADPVEVED